MSSSLQTRRCDSSPRPGAFPRAGRPAAASAGLAYPRPARAREEIVREPVAVLGGGVSGTAACALLEHLGAAHTLFDERSGSSARRAFSAEDARAFPWVVYSPGFPQDHPWLRVAREAGCRTLGELDLAALFWEGELIAVTGTNGKTTLTELLASALRRGGLPALAAGNNGYAFSRHFEYAGAKQPGAVAVVEVSSFQAEELHYLEIDGLLWTNFTEDHLDRYATPADYFAAKANLLTRLRRPFVVTDETVLHAARTHGLRLPESTVIAEPPETYDLPLQQASPFARAPQDGNLAMAAELWCLLGHPLPVLLEAARSFHLAAHRQQPVAEIDGVAYCDDSKATNFASALAALRGAGAPLCWIAGGRGKGGDIAAFAREAAPYVREAFLIGETAEALQSALEQAGVRAHLFPDLRPAVHAARRAACPGDVVLLSPGFGSQDQFTSYAERGRVFAQTVFDLKQGRLAR